MGVTACPDPHEEPRTSLGRPQAPRAPAPSDGRKPPEPPPVPRPAAPSPEPLIKREGGMVSGRTSPRFVREETVPPSLSHRPVPDRARP